MSDTIAALPSQLHSTASSVQTQSGTIGDLITNLNSSTQGLISSISISPLGNFSGALETLYGRIGISMNCFTDALHDLGTSLHAAAQGFSTTDVQLANTFHILDQALQPYVGFDAPKMALPTATQSHPSVKPQPPSWFEQTGSWISTHANEAGHWVMQHPWIIPVVVIGAAALIFFTGGTAAPALGALAF